MKMNNSNQKKILIVAYNVAVGVFILVFSTIIPFQQAEEARIVYTNMLFVEYKQANNLQYVDEASEVAKKIRMEGHNFGKEKYKELSGKYGLLACVLVLLLTLLLTFTKLNDLMWIGGEFAILYGLGSLNTESFIFILLLTFLSYSVKKWRLRADKE